MIIHSVITAILFFVGFFLGRKTVLDKFSSKMQKHLENSIKWKADMELLQKQLIELKSKNTNQ